MACAAGRTSGTLRRSSEGSPSSSNSSAGGAGIGSSEPDASGRSQISVRIGSAVFNADHPILPQGRIEMRAIVIDRQRSQRQLALTVQQVDGCVHHLLAYTPRRLVRLLPIVGESGCQLPSLAGDGVVEAAVWEDPGHRKARYRLGSDGLSMTREARPAHELGQAAKIHTR